MNNLIRYINSQKEQIKTIEWAYRVHLGALFVLIMGILLTWISPTTKVIQHALLFIASLGFAVGFSIWCWSYLVKTWAHPIGKVIITVSHLFVFLLATILARNLVSSAIGLPPQDFDLTVGFMAFAFYIPAWSIVASVLLGIFAIILELIWLISMVTELSSRSKMKVLANMFGAIAVCSYSGNIYNLVSKNEKSLYPLVKWVAFLSDFQAAPLYPGIGKDERVRLHENGIISVAKVQNNEVRIFVRSYGQQQLKRSIM